MRTCHCYACRARRNPSATADLVPIALIGGVGLIGFMVLNAQKAAGNLAAGISQGVRGTIANTGQAVNQTVGPNSPGLGPAIGAGISGGVGAAVPGLPTLIGWIGGLFNPGYLWKGTQKHDDGLCWVDTQWPDGSWTSVPAIGSC